MRERWETQLTSHERRRFRLLSKTKIQLGAGILLACALILGFTNAADVGINSGAKTEFGQGVVPTVACDTTISTSLTSKIDTATGMFYIDTLTLGDLSTRLHDRKIIVQLISKSGDILNSYLSFDVASDGLTYTSTRAHIDDLDAFATGAGANREIGTSKITFTGFATEESSLIPSSEFRNVTLQTSGNGACSIPANTKAVEVYVDAPYVQGSYIAEDYPQTTLVDDFNTATTNNSACPSNGVTGTFAGGNCVIFLRTQGGTYQYGGAITTSSTPTTGGATTNQSPSAAITTAAGETITMTSRKNYIGFWWSAGSTGNTVEFYRGSTKVAEFNSIDVANAIPKNSTQLTAKDGTTKYTKSNYYGHPLNTVTMAPAEAFVYFHCFAVNGFNFDKVVLKSSGFEFDNFTVSSLGGSQLTPKSTLVFIKSYNYSG